MAAIIIEVSKIPADLLEYFEPLQQTKGSLWTIPTQACKEAHFATYPEKLVQPMIEAGCPMYVCDKCRKPRKKIYETDYHKHRPSAGNDPRSRAKDKFTEANGTSGWQGNNLIADRFFKGYSSCGCNASFSPGIVLDPFGGMCTSAVVAYKLKRDYVMIELNKEYIKMAEKRLNKVKDNYSLIENNPCIVPEPVIKLKETNLFKEQVL